MSEKLLEQTTNTTETPETENLSEQIENIDIDNIIAIVDAMTPEERAFAKLLLDQPEGADLFSFSTEELQKLLESTGDNGSTAPLFAPYIVTNPKPSLHNFPEEFQNELFRDDARRQSVVEDPGTVPYIDSSVISD